MAAAKASGSVTPLPAVIDFDKARAQLASFQQAKNFSAPLVEACPECLLNAAGTGAGSGAAAVSSAADIPDDCLDLVCIDADGSPAKNLPYVVTLTNGSPRTGKLDGEGKAHLTGLPPGAVTVEYQPEDNEAEIKALRNDIAKALNEIIQSEKAESAKIQVEYEQQSALGRACREHARKARSLRADGGSGAAAGKLCLLFPGEGSQYPDMLAELCVHFPQVRDAFGTEVEEGGLAFLLVCWQRDPGL